MRLCGARTVSRLCSQFVSIAEVSERCVVLAAMGEQPMTTVEGLAPQCESIPRGEGAPEAHPGWQSSGKSGGLPPRKRAGGTR